MSTCQGSNGGAKRKSKQSKRGKTNKRKGGSKSQKRSQSQKRNQRRSQSQRRNQRSNQKQRGGFAALLKEALVPFSDLLQPIRNTAKSLEESSEEDAEKELLVEKDVAN